MAESKVSKKSVILSIATSWKQSTHISWYGSGFCEVSDGLEEEEDDPPMRQLLTGPCLCSTYPWSCSACSLTLVCVCACQPSFWKMIPIKCYMWRLNICLVAEGTYFISIVAQTGHAFLDMKNLQTVSASLWKWL